MLDKFNIHIQAKILLERFSFAMQQKQKEILSVCL